MTATRRELILDEMAATLAGITVAAGYRTDVETVEQAIRDPEDVGPGQRPWIGVAVTPVRVPVPRYAPSNRIEMTLYVLVVAYVAALPGAARTSALSDLEDDIIAALHVDSRRGGQAIDTMLIEGPITNEALPDAIPRDGTGELRMLWQVRYQRTTSADT